MSDAKAASKGSGKKGGTKDYKNLTGRQKAAIFLVSLGSDVSSEIMKHLRDDEVETLTFEIARLETVDSDFKEQVLEEFQELMSAQNFITTGGIDYARELLEKSLGYRYYQPSYFKFAGSSFRLYTPYRSSPPAQLYSAGISSDNRLDSGLFGSW